MSNTESLQPKVYNYKKVMSDLFKLNQYKYYIYYTPCNEIRRI